MQRAISAYNLKCLCACLSNSLSLSPALMTTPSRRLAALVISVVLFLSLVFVAPDIRPFLQRYSIAGVFVR